MNGFRSATIRCRLTPRCRRVSSRTRCLNRATAFSAMHRRNKGSSLTVAEERSLPRSGDRTLLCVHLKLEAAFNEAGQARRDLPAGLFAADVDVTVSRAGESHPRALADRAEDWRAGLGRCRATSPISSTSKQRADLSGSAAIAGFCPHGTRRAALP